jgi:hypothetical protein
MKMQNLAGNKKADEYIRRELERARISVALADPHNFEVPFTIIGRLGDFVFTRAWTYWVVVGRVPFDVAEELFSDPVGRTDIRVTGHAGCPSPAEWVGVGKPVTSYHIDSEVGLRIFADTLRAHNLATDSVAG